TWYDYSEIDTSLKPGESINRVHCIGFDSSNTNINGTGSITITGNNIVLGGNCDPSVHHSLEIEVGFVGLSKTISLDALSGLGEVQ
ncbi:hypothetical protein MK079_03155, partial [Candidatus Gracilibacteria bacterium]|nr:hypothetical protein [Candidatus Gracilibacteria bacterium]